MRRKTIAAIIAVIAFSIVIQGAAALDIADGRPPDGKVGQLYFYQLNVTPGSGSPPLTWVVPHSGIFPPGLRAIPVNNTRSLQIVGNPTTPGTYTFYIQLRDSPGPWVCCTEERYTINIAPADKPVPPDPTPPPVESDLTAEQFPYTGPYYGPEVNLPKRKGDTALALKLIMRDLGYDSFTNPDRYYNLRLETAMRKFQMDRGIRPTGNYGKGSWEAVRKARTQDGSLAAGQTARILVSLEAARK